MPDPAETFDDKIRLVGSDLEIPRLGLGTWAWGDRTTWGMNDYDPSYGTETIREAYECSVVQGVTLLDTAEAYGAGESERIIGRLLQADPGNRDRVVVATKFLPLPWRFPMRTAFRKALRDSLERLQIESVDLYQIHGPISLRRTALLADLLAEAVHQGKVSTVGVSNYSEREMAKMHAALARRGVTLATNQIEMSLLRTMPLENGLVDACRDLGVTVLAYSPLAQGRLTGKYNAQKPPPGRRQFSDFPMEEVDPIVRRLRTIGKAHGGKTPAQVALNWIMCKGAVPIPGAKNREQAEQNAGALGWRLDEGEVRALDKLSKHGRRTFFHRLWQHG